MGSRGLLEEHRTLCQPTLNAKTRADIRSVVYRLSVYFASARSLRLLLPMLHQMRDKVSCEFAVASMGNDEEHTSDVADGFREARSSTQRAEERDAALATP